MPKSPTFESTSPSTEVTPPSRTRRKFSPAEKLRIVKAAAACRERGELEALLRREGIYSSHLSAWRKAIEQHGVDGLGAIRTGRKRKLDAKDVRIASLEKKSARLEKELELAKKLIELQKKASEILGIELPKEEE